LSALTLALQRVLRAPRPVVFATFCNPAELAKWWGPKGFTTPRVEFDPRVGGGTIESHLHSRGPRIIERLAGVRRDVCPAREHELHTEVDQIRRPECSSTSMTAGQESRQGPLTRQRRREATTPP
jgi:uncharacterized protein YndB with AHSA1/START domain